jgi:hypothetical protein
MGSRPHIAAIAAAARGGTISNAQRVVAISLRDTLP